MKDLLYPPKILENSSLRRVTLRWSHFEAALFSIMVGCSETFALYYAVKRGVSESELALISVLPPLLGAIANWVLPQFVSREKLKRFVLVTVGIQVLGLLGLFFSTQFSDHFTWILISLSLYWIGGTSSGPLWTDWMTPWLPKSHLGRYLFRRNSFVGLITVMSYLLAASWIYNNTSLAGYQFIFALAVLARLGSWLILYGQLTPQRVTEVTASEITQPAKLSTAFSSRSILAILFFTIAFRFCTHTSSPFFLSYMVNELHFSLFTYAWITAVPFLARAMFMNAWGEALRTFRPFVAFQVAMLMLAGVCFAWTQTTSLTNLSLIEAISGLAWAGFDLSILIALNAFAPGRSRSIVGFHSALSFLAALLGALYGSHLLKNGWSSIELFHYSAALRLMMAVTFIVASRRIQNEAPSVSMYGQFILTALSLRHSLIGQIGFKNRNSKAFKLRKKI